MRGTIKLKVLPELQLTLFSISGDISPQLPKDFLSKLENEVSFNPKYNVIGDFRNSNIVLNQEELKELATFFMQHPTYNGRRREAYIVTSSKEMASLSMFSMHSRFGKVEFDVVRTLREAFAFLELEIKFMLLVKSTLTELKIS